MDDSDRYYEGIAQAFLKAIRPFGYRNAILVHLAGHAVDHVHVLAMPRKALEHYVSKRSEGSDPILKHALVARMPFFWDDLEKIEHISASETLFMETMRDHKVASGITVPLTHLNGQRAFMSLSAHKRQESDETTVGALLALCNQYHRDWHAGLKHGRPELAVWPTPKLTRRQVECLKYCLDGLSSSEIGVEIGVCENTVQFHISNAMQQLGVSNRTTAVVRAVELGLL